MPILMTRLDARSAAHQQNRNDMLTLLAELDALMDKAAGGGGEKATARLIASGKLPMRERVALLLDPDSPFLELSPLAGHLTHYKDGAGALMGIGVICGVECVIFANDPTDMGGAMTPLSMTKIVNSLRIARQNRMPYVQIIESSGGDLRRAVDDIDPEYLLKADLNHFGDSGHVFYGITELSKLGIPTVSVVCGNSTAGGAYMPGLSEYNIFIRGRAQVFLAGPPLLKVATGEEASAEELGGADMHAAKSGLCDYLAETETEGLGMARDVIEHLNWTKQGYGPTQPSKAPLYDKEELLGIVPKDLKAAVDIREVIARIVDGSELEQFKPVYSPTMVCGWAHIHGFAVANRLGAENQGFSYIMRNFNAERMFLAASCLGYSKVCYEYARDYAQQRQTFGKRLADHQVIRHKLSRMIMEIIGLETMIYSVATPAASGSYSPVAETALMKVKGSETFEFCANEAMQILGGHGFMRDNPVERLYRETKVQAIGGGSAEIMLDLAARQYGF